MTTDTWPLTATGKLERLCCIPQSPGTSLMAMRR